MDKTDISIIMPVYNGEKYLSETLRNLLKQTYKNFELICINDASTDSTLNILKKFQNLDERIQILQNDEHSGAGSSRNKGIQEAKGKYITFLDGDDIFEEEMLETAYRAMEKYELDIVIYELISIPSEHIYEKKKKWRSNRFVEKYCMYPFSARQCKPDRLMDWGSSPCNKLYRKNFIKENRLEFQSLQSANDVYFVNMALLLAEKMLILDDRRVMIYARDHNVVTRISYDREPMCSYQAMWKLGQELVDRGVFSDVFQHYYCLLFYILRAGILGTKSMKKAKEFYGFLQKKGINEIKALNYEYYEKLDRYIHDLIENYINLDFDSGWYKFENIFAYHLYENTKNLVSLFSEYDICNKRTILWGAGMNGRRFVKFLHKNGLNVSGVVDKDEQKQGTVFEGYEIRRPEEIIGKIQVVMVCSFLVYQEVMSELKGTGIEVINIEKMLQEE